MVVSFKKAMPYVGMLFLLCVCHSMGYAQQISKTVSYEAEFQPFGEGIRKEFTLPSEIKSENYFQIGFVFDLKPEDITANVTATLIFDQDNGTIQVRGKDGNLQSEGGISLEAVVRIVCTLPPIPFVVLDPIIIDPITIDPIFIDVEIPFSISNFLNAEVLKKLPSIGLPAINALDGWDTSESFNSLLFNGKPIELRGGIRELVRAELQATDIVEAIIDAVTKSVSVPLPPIALKALGKAFEIALGNAAISYNLGFLSTLTLTGQSITVNGEQLMSEDQIIKAPGLDLSADTYTVDSSYEEQFTYQLDFVASSDVWLEFNPLGIPVWSYPKTVIAEFPSPLIPKQEVNLNFTSNQTTFPLTEALPAASLVAADAIDHRLLLVDGPSQTVDMAPYFSSQSGLIYEVSSSPSGVVTESVSGSRVTIAPLQIGNTSVIVRAFDRNDEDLYAIQTIPVLVYTNRATIVRPPSPFTPPTTSHPSVERLEVGVSVIVQNTNRSGINIRSNPWVSNNNPDNRIGNVHDGATGTITDGSESNGGFTWWKIDWDTVNKEGWSVEVFQGSQLLFPRPPDLEIRDFDVSNDDVKPGEEFRLEAEILNNGPGKSEPTEIYFYYQTLDKEEDIRVAGKGKVEVPSLRKDECREVFLTVTAPMTPHTDYDYGAILPPDIPETYDAELVDPTRQIRLNNIAEVVRVEVRSDPDLIVESISVRDGEVTLTSGEAFTLEATLRNQGIGEPERNATLHYYRSWDASISTRDTEVGTDTVSSGNLDTNETEDESIRLTAPTEPGIYYYGACVDLKYESDTDNNCSGSVAITVRETRHSDLLVSLLTLSDNTLAPGASFTLQATVQNQGSGTARPTTLRSYQSSNASISPNDTEVGSVNVSSLSADETEIQAFTLNAPLAASTYYYGASIESVSNESNTANNYSTGVALRVENLAPVTVGTMPAETLAVEDLFLKVDLSPYFSDPNSDVLTYAVESAAPEVVKVDLSGVSSSILRMTPLAAGDATITIEVSDGELTATQALVVSVTDDVSEASWMPDANLRAKVREALGLAPSDILTQEALAELTSVNFDNNDIKDLTGLEHATQLTNVSLGWNQVVDITPLSGLTRLTELHLRYTELVDLSPLSGLTQLTGLQLSGNQVVDLMPLVGLTRLTWLDLSWNQVVDVTPLAGLTRLTWLSLSSNQISDVSGLEGLINLEKLSLKENPVADLAPLRRLKSKNPGVDIDIDISDVTMVVSEETWMPDANLREAVREALGLAPGDVLTQQAMQGLTKLDASLPWGAPASVKVVSDLTGLEHATQLTSLGLGSNKVVDVSALSGLTQLTRLDLSGNDIVDISVLSGLTQLTSLDLGGNDIVDISPLSGLTQLTLLYLWGNEGVDISPLVDLTQLTSLDLRWNDIVDISVLSGLTQLTWLDLGGNEGVDISPLSALTRLTWLSLGSNQISDVSALEGLINLRSLSLKENPVADLAPLRRLKSKNPGVDIDIDISDVTMVVSEETWMPDANLREAVREALGLAPGDVLTQQAMQGLTKLDASLPWGAPASVKVVSDLTGLEHATQLTSLGLGSNKVVDVSALSGLTQLTRLDLSGNDIVDISVLSGLTQLTSLDLGGNDIVDISPLSGLTQLTLLYLWGNEGVDISPLVGLTQLTSLDLRWNDIVDISVLSGLTQLTWLDLGGNEGVDISPLSALTRLTWLSLGSNQISDVSALEGLINLRSLSLKENPVADLAPLRRLKSKNPGVDIDIDISDVTTVVSEASWMPDANLRAAVREALGLAPGDVLTKEAMQRLTRLNVSVAPDVPASEKISDLTGLAHATQLTTLELFGNKVT